MHPPIHSTWRRNLRRVTLAASALTLVGCVDLEEVKLYDFGVFTTEAIDAGGSPGLRVSGRFIRVPGLGAGVGTPETCWDLLYADPLDAADILSIDAGVSLTATVSGKSQTIDRLNSFGRISYPAPLDLITDYTPGDTMRITIPGAAGGFPAGQAAFRTAEALVMPPVTIPASGQPMNVTWTPASLPGSFVTASLRYPQNTPTPTTRQVYCVWTDDGAGPVPASILSAFLAANEAEREMVFTRVRVWEGSVGGGAQAVAYSYYSLPLPGATE